MIERAKERRKSTIRSIPPQRSADEKTPEARFEQQPCSECAQRHSGQQQHPWQEPLARRQGATPLGQRRVVKQVLQYEHVQDIDAITEPRTLAEPGTGLCVGGAVAAQPQHDRGVEGEDAAGGMTEGDKMKSCVAPATQEGRAVEPESRQTQVGDLVMEIEENQIEKPEQHGQQPTTGKRVHRRTDFSAQSGQEKAQPIAKIEIKHKVVKAREAHPQPRDTEEGRHSKQDEKQPPHRESPAATAGGEQGKEPVGKPTDQKTPEQHGEEPEVGNAVGQPPKEDIPAETVGMEEKQEVVESAEDEAGDNETLEFLPYEGRQRGPAPALHALIAEHVAAHKGDGLDAKAAHQMTQPPVEGVGGHPGRGCPPTGEHTKRVIENQQEDDQRADDGDFVEECLFHVAKIHIFLDTERGWGKKREMPAC